MRTSNTKLFDEIDALEEKVSVEANELEVVKYIEKLEHTLVQVLELAQRDSEQFGGQRKDIAERVKEVFA